MTTLNTLKIGQSATIQSFTDEFLSLKLIEMGCLPGETVKLTNIAPFGDPIAIEVSGYLLSLRKQEASTVVVKINVENTTKSCVI
jgi:ferrous iron transport protein A